jgi:hypothetical protein
MGKRSAVVELFLGDMGSMQRELRPSTQREDQLTMETKLEQIAVKAVNQLPKSVVREIRTPRSVGAGGGRPPPATRWARGNSRPYRESGWLAVKTALMTQSGQCADARFGLVLFSARPVIGCDGQYWGFFGRCGDDLVSQVDEESNAR